MNSDIKIKDLNINEKPRERLVNQGVQALSDAELLAIILRTGGKENSAITLSTQILNTFGGINGLISSDIEEIKKIKNIGYAKATCIKAVCELALRINSTKNSLKVAVKKPADIHELLKKELFAKETEHLYLVSLNSRNQVISKDLISLGTVNETLTHPREIYRQALAKNAVAVILAHNHPSGDPNPSTDDIIITQRIAKAGITLGIPLIDHVIISNHEFVSLKALNLFEVPKGGD